MKTEHNSKNNVSQNGTPVNDRYDNGKISVDGKQMREKPGFFKRIWHSMRTGGLDKQTLFDPAMKQLSYNADLLAFGLGLSPEEAHAVGSEVAEHAKLNGIDPSNLTQQKLDALLRGSKTFCGTNEGLAYIEEKFGFHSQQELKARELADRIITEMPQLNIKTPSKFERDNFDFGLVIGTGSSWARSFIDPKDFSLQREAANLAFSLGMSKKDSILVGEEVFRQADAVSGKDKTYNLNDLLAKSPTFSTYEQGVQYLQKARLDMAVDRIHLENLEQMQAKADNEKATAANKLRSKYGMNPLDTANPANGIASDANVGMTTGNSLDRMPVNPQAGNTIGQGGAGNFMSSVLGRVLMVAVGFLLTKLVGGSNLAGLVAGGAGGLLSPVVGKLINSFGSRSDMAQQGIEQLEAYDRRSKHEGSRSQSQELGAERQQGMRNERGIEDRPIGQTGNRELTNAELMSVVREKGIDGVHAYFGADEKKFNDFLNRNNLNELACNEARIRLEGGDWLKATRDGLSAMNAGTASLGVAETGKHLSVG